MKKLQNPWNWIKNRIESINFGVVLLVLAFMVWFSVHTLSVETQLSSENEFLKESLIRTEQTLSEAIRHINDQEAVVRMQKTTLEGQEVGIKKLIERINYLTALLNGEYT